MHETRRGIASDDRGVALYHVVYPHEGFAESAQTLFTLIRRAQAVKPGARRMLFLDIEGHRRNDPYVQQLRTAPPRTTPLD